MYPTLAQEEQMRLHCAHARYVWNLAVEQRSYWARHKGNPPGFAEQCRQLTEARRASEWLQSGNVGVQQQALKDFQQAVKRRFDSGFGEPTWRKRYRHEGFRVIGTGRVPEFEPDGTPRLNAKGKQVMARSVVTRKLNKRWAQVKVPGCGWVRFRLTRRELPAVKTFRVTWRTGQWHVAFATIPEPVAPPGFGEIIGIDRGVTITAALSDGRKLDCPQLSDRERMRLRKHERRAARAAKGSPQERAEYATVAKIRATEAARRKDWVEKTSTMLAVSFDLIRFEKLNIKNMTASAKGTAEAPGKRVAQKSGLNRAILAQGWGLLRRRTEQKAPGRVEDIPAPYTSLRCSACGWIEKDSRKSQAEFSCVHCGYACNADTNAAINVAAGHCRRDNTRQGPSVREPQPGRGPQPASVGISVPLGGEDVNRSL